MKKYRVLSAFCLGGEYGDVYEGTIVTLDPKDAGYNLYLKRIVEVEPGSEPAPVPAAPSGKAGKGKEE
jgi:hypothetical protein